MSLWILEDGNIRLDSDVVEFAIREQGIAMAAATLGFAFEEFQSGDSIFG